MATLDPYLKKVAACVEEARRAGRPVREFAGAGDPDPGPAALPVRVGPAAGGGLILRGDTFVELGGPDAASCAFPLWTHDPGLLRDGRIVLIGPDIGEAPGGRLPFGQVVMVSGRDLADADLATLEQSQYVADQIEGYMIRSTPGRLWSRVSKDAAEKGFDFEVLGRALCTLFKAALPRIEAMEVLFVTSGREDVEPLCAIAEQVRTIGRLIERETWLAKGVDLLECTLGVDCRTCSDKPECDEIRDVVKIRKTKQKEAARS